MPEVTPTRRQEGAELSIQKLIDKRYAIQQERKEVAAEDRELKKQMNDIDARLFAYNEENPEVAVLHGTGAKVSFSEERVFNIEAGKKDEVKQHLIDNDITYLMTWHLNNASLRDFEAMHDSLPHVEPYVKKKVSCTKR